jgi:hypothetical protein
MKSFYHFYIGQLLVYSTTRVAKTTIVRTIPPITKLKKNNKNKNNYHCYLIFCFIIDN